MNAFHEIVIHVIAFASHKFNQAELIDIYYRIDEPQSTGLMLLIQRQKNVS